VIWVVVAALNVFTIVAFAEGEIDRGKFWRPLLLGLAVPTALYCVGLAWDVLRKK
jgi:hypothetical protein